jgi:hypothetical protein
MNSYLYKVMKVAINSANQPSTNDVLELLIKVINHNFDFCKKVSVNMELMQLTRHEWLHMVLSLVSHSSC